MFLRGLGYFAPQKRFVRPARESHLGAMYPILKDKTCTTEFYLLKKKNYIQFLGLLS
jgi:hypothetical protein